MRVLAFGVLALCLLAVTTKAQEDELEEEFNDDGAIVDDDMEPGEEEPAPAEEKPKLVYKQPKAKGNTFLTETFESEADFNKHWVKSSAKKEDTDADIAKYDGQWSVEEPKDNPLEGDKGLVLKSRAKHHAVAGKLSRRFDFVGKPFIVQYEVKFQSGQECGGAYIKLLSDAEGLTLSQFYDKTPYTIMFGPDKCGNDAKLHFIFRHRNPISGKTEEKHAKKPKASLDTYFTDKHTHLYTLVVNPDNTFEVYVDRNMINSGSLLEDMEPPVNPAKEIVDPNDKKPSDWDEREKIPDPDATKPDDWDESEPEFVSDPDAVIPEGWLEDTPEFIADPDSEKPSDWDEDMDGEWEPPMISNPECEDAPGCGEWTAPKIKNPKYKGKWKAALIENPNYKGKWKPQKIENPDFFEDTKPYEMTSVAAIGLELWSMSDDIYFDNFIITDDKSVADAFAADSWEIKHNQELHGSSSGRSVVDAVLAATAERPWLWAVILIVLVLPVVLVIAYCCMPGGGSKPADIKKKREENAARRKKTDDASPDDQESDDEEAEEEGDGEGEGEQQEESVTKEQQTEVSGADKQASGDATSAKPAAKSKKSDLEAEEKEPSEGDQADNEEDDDAAPAPGTPTRSSPRKRKPKPRKE